MRCAENVKVALGGLVLGIIVVVAALAVAWPARADADPNFANQLHGYGIYGQKDYHLLPRADVGPTAGSGTEVTTMSL
jgi:hypothetical protein